MDGPLVSVIVLCHNQGAYLRDAANSVLHQTYPFVQIILTDDGSRDDSPQIAQALKAEFPQIELLLLDENLGNCKAFNRALKLVKGEYIIDLAADDWLHPERIAKGLADFESLGPEYGVHFTDLMMMDENGLDVQTFYKGLSKFNKNLKAPEGDVYRPLLEKYLISAPSMMIRKKVFDELGGYDESLLYEDFDFWLRSSRTWKYGFRNEVLVKKREIPQSLGARQYLRGSKYLLSTYMVCRKAFALNCSKTEYAALLKRILFESKMALKVLKFPLFFRYMALGFRVVLRLIA